MSNQRRLNVVSRDGWCRHRTPFTKDHPVCKVGVDFHKFDQRDMPCLGESERARAACVKFAGWTVEDIAERESRFSARMNAMGVIRPAIVERVKQTGERSGQMPCPVCKTGTVSYSQASNGHVHAVCSASCASWME